MPFAKYAKQIRKASVQHKDAAKDLQCPPRTCYHRSQSGACLGTGISSPSYIGAPVIGRSQDCLLGASLCWTMSSF